MSATKDIRSKIKGLAGSTGASMVPTPHVSKPNKKEEILPSVDTLVHNARVRLRLAQIVDRIGKIGLEVGILSAGIKPLEDEKRKLAEEAKVIASTWGLDKAVCGDWKLSYYRLPERVVSESWALRVSSFVEEEE